MNERFMNGSVKSVTKLFGGYILSKAAWARCRRARGGAVGMDRQLNMKTMKFAAAFHCNMHAIRVPTTIET